MADAWSALLVTLMARAAMPMGADVTLSSSCCKVPTRLTHGLVPFTGGASLAAVALVLLPPAARI